MSDLGPRRRDPNNPLTVPLPRFGTKYDDIDLNKVNPTLLQIVRAGAEWLPEGYRVQVTSGDRPKPKLKGSRHRGGGALDVEIVDPNGNVIPSEGPPGGGDMYRRLAHGVYNEAHRISPELASQVAWGGEFESVPGKSGLADYMHFDLGGRRGQWAQQGWAMPAAPGSGPPVQLAAPTPVPNVTLDDPNTRVPLTNVPPALQGPIPGTETPPEETAAAQPPAYMDPKGTDFASGLRPRQAVSTEPPSYTEAPSSPDDSAAQLTEDNSLLSGLTQPQRGISLTSPFEARQPATSYQPNPDIAPNLYSGGAVPGAMAQAAQGTNTGLPDITSNLLAPAAGGPSEPGPRDTPGAGGPNDQDPDKNPMRAATVAALIGAMMKGMKVTPINWDPFSKILHAGQADTSMPRSALATSPLGKLVSERNQPVGTSTGPIQPRPVDAGSAAAPRNIYERMNLGLAQRRDVNRAGPETAA